VQPAAQKLPANKAYDSDRLRAFLEGHDTTPVVPNRWNRIKPFTFPKKIYKHHNKIERIVQPATLLSVPLTAAVHRSRKPM
jgi:hypothetical protein